MQLTFNVELLDLFGISTYLHASKEGFKHSNLTLEENVSKLCSLVYTLIFFNLLVFQV